MQAPALIELTSDVSLLRPPADHEQQHRQHEQADRARLYWLAANHDSTLPVGKPPAEQQSAQGPLLSLAALCAMPWLTAARRLGILAPDEVPDWRSARQKREVARALGMRQMPYVSGVAGLMRSGLEPPVARPDDRDPDVREKPDDASKDAGKDRVRVIPADQTGRLRITHKPGKRRSTFRTPR